MQRCNFFEIALDMYIDMWYNILEEDYRKVMVIDISNVNLIRNLNLFSVEAKSGTYNSILHVPLLDPPTVFNYTNDIYSFLRQQDMEMYLGIYEKYFNCIFHPDHEKKASVFQKSNGDWAYKCFNKDCPFKFGDINKVTECLTKLNRPNALTYLMDIYNIVLEKTEIQKQHEEIIDSNLQLMHDEEELMNNYPFLYNRIKKILPQLKIMHLYAKYNITLESAVKDNYVTFTAPMRKIATALIEENQKGRLETISKRTNMLTFLGLILKLSDSEFTEDELESAIKYSQSKGFKNYINLYGLPSYSYETLNYAEKRSIEFKEAGMTVGEFTYPMLEQYGGTEVLNTVFPRKYNSIRNKKITTLSEDVEMEILGLIKNKGYCLYSDILDSPQYLNFLRVRFNDRITKKELEHSMKTIIPKMTIAYDLVKTRMNNKLKQHFNLDIKGYSNVLVKREDAEA
jgi:hypothetical protein